VFSVSWWCFCGDGGLAGFLLRLCYFLLAWWIALANPLGVTDLFSALSALGGRLLSLFLLVGCTYFVSGMMKPFPVHRQVRL